MKSSDCEDVGDADISNMFTCFTIVNDARCEYYSVLFHPKAETVILNGTRENAPTWIAIPNSSHWCVRDVLMHVYGDAGWNATWKTETGFDEMLDTPVRFVPHRLAGLTFTDSESLP